MESNATTEQTENTERSASDLDVPIQGKGMGEEAAPKPKKGEKSKELP